LQYFQQHLLDLEEFLQSSERWEIKKRTNWMNN
jgi:hypothetical protein